MGEIWGRYLEGSELRFERGERGCGDAVRGGEDERALVLGGHGRVGRHAHVLGDRVSRFGKPGHAASRPDAIGKRRKK